MSDRVLIKLCDSLDADCFGVTYDFCHYGVGRPNDYVQAIYALGPRICNLHFSDSDLKSSELHFPLGSGRMNLEAILEALRSIRTMEQWLWISTLPAACSRLKNEHCTHARSN